MHRALASDHSAKRRIRPAWLVFACLGLAPLELRSLAGSCAACHGTDGHSAPSSSVPSLAHLPREYMIARMRAFREDSSLASSLMAQIAKGYDDQQLEKLADYFASQP
jgi:cytochrome c553